MTPKDQKRIEALARYLYECEYPKNVEWEKLLVGQRVKYLATARTIESAHLCRQTAVDAAHRLGVWHAVDNRLEIGWDKRSKNEQRYFLTAAERGFFFLNRLRDNV